MSGDEQAAPARVAAAGDLALMIGPRNKRYVVRLRSDGKVQTHEGEIKHSDLIGQPFGRRVWSHLGRAFLVLEPSVHDIILLSIKRRGQIIYPKDAGEILLRLNLRNGSRVVEAGTGSGGLTIAMAWTVAPDGKVFSYEARADMQETAVRNVASVGLSDRVEFKTRDIAEGFDETGVDALFLDVRNPWDYLKQAHQALTLGGFFGGLVPTTNQVCDLIAGLEVNGFADIEVEELLVRQYKPVAQRLRPVDLMIGHTGYLVFARKIWTNSLEAEPAANER